MPETMQNPSRKKTVANRFLKRFTGASNDPKIEARLEEVMAQTYDFFPMGIDIKLDRTYRLLERLGNPHLRLPKTVHIAGTNGKGSTTAALRALLEAAGQTVHVYTSPHLVHPTERIRLAGKLISSEAMIDALTKCIETNKKEPITAFELLTCAAFLTFHRTPADWLLLETGMGGRLDATNVVHSDATIITTVSYDHQGFLGNSIEKIAAEKAGIMKPGIPCVIGRQIHEEAYDVFQKRSKALSPEAYLAQFGAEWSAEPFEDRMLFRYDGDTYVFPKPNLQGFHQIGNAGAALAAFRLIAPERFKPEIISTALGNIEWPGRLQILENHPYNDLVPPRCEIFIDGGHNDSAGQVLADKLQAWCKDGAGPTHLIVAMVNRKDAIAFLKPMAPFAATITVTEIEDEETSYKKEELAKAAKQAGFESIFMATSTREALYALNRNFNLHDGGRILITGSLYLMGTILKL
jgi:dihydrofolate synthase/folylpolyglutamate synthase